jgi:thioredoxin reductase (NADPH)
MEKNNSFAVKPKEGEPWDIVIIGSGPAALTAAIYTTRGAASTLIIGGEVWGGQLMLTTTVDNFPGFPEGVEGPDLIKKMRQQAERFGAEFIEKNVEVVDFDPPAGGPFEIIAGGVKYYAKSIIIATGADTKWLNVPGEKEFIGRGVSSCAPCDAPFFKDKKVAVVGGGDSAMEEALTLTKYALEVTLIHRRDQFRASAAMQKRVLENTKIKVIWNTEVIRIGGSKSVEKLVLKNAKTGEESELAIGGVFIAIGHVPATQKFSGHVETDEKGYIKRTQNSKPKTQNENQYQSETNIPGVFVAGDVHDWHYRQAISAAGFGCMAGIEVLKYLDKDAPSW